MKTIVLTITAGIAATIVMTILTMVAGLLGMPTMNPPRMMATIMETTVAVGWIMHFLIGVIFAFLYAYLFLPVLKRMENPVLRGSIFGVAAFIIAQLAMGFIATMARDFPTPDKNTLAMAIGSLVGHMVFGIILALVIKKPVKE